ncbi:MAG: DMT family transporter [Alphaproteobacteria bacterium]
MKTLFKQNPVYIGIAFALAQSVTAAFVGLFAKLASEIHHPTEVMFYRSFLCLLIVTAFLAAQKRLPEIKRANKKSQMIRGIVGTAGMILTFWGFALLPLSEIQSILFAAPIFVAALSYPVLGEKVGKYRIIATLIGFGGVMMIVQPGVISSFLGGMVALGAAFFHAAVMLILRWIGRTEEPMITVFYFALISTLIMLPIMPFTMSMPTPYSMFLLLMVGISVFFLQICLTNAYVYADATIIAPITYISLIWMILLDLFVWGYLPQLPTIIGACIIMVSSFVIIWREARLKNNPKPNLSAQ